MSRGICRNRSDIFHLRKNGVSSTRTITDKSGLSRSTLEFRERSTDIMWFSLVFAARPLCAFLGHSLSWTFVIFRLFFYYTSCCSRYFCSARTFRMAFNRRSESPRGCGKQWQQGKKTGGEADCALPRDNVDKNASAGEDSSSILPKSDR